MYLKRNRELEIISLYRTGYRQSFYLRQISRLAKLPVKTVQTLLAHLEEESILTSKVDGKNKYFSLNRGNIHTKSMLLISEVYATSKFLETYTLFKTFAKSLPAGSLIVVFGSYARYKPAKHSDVDILTTLEKDQQLPGHLLPYKIHHINLTEQEFKKSAEQGETLIKEIEESHIILGNHSLYVDVMWGKDGR